MPASGSVRQIVRYLIVCHQVPQEGPLGVSIGEVLRVIEDVLNSIALHVQHRLRVQTACFSTRKHVHHAAMSWWYLLHAGNHELGIVEGAHETVDRLYADRQQVRAVYALHAGAGQAHGYLLCDHCYRVWLTVHTRRYTR